jgi:signal transduction histidine kinase
MTDRGLLEEPAPRASPPGTAREGNVWHLPAPRERDGRGGSEDGTLSGTSRRGNAAVVRLPRARRGSAILAVAPPRGEGAVVRLPVTGGSVARDSVARDSVARDSLAREAAEDAKRRDERASRQVEKLSRTGRFGWNNATGAFFWSEETFHIFDHDPSEVVTWGMILARVHPRDVPLVTRRITRASGAGAVDFECRLTMPGGAEKLVRVVAHPGRDRDGRIEYIGAIQDITRQWRSEEALDKARSDLAYLARVSSVGALTASIVHEINQPLAGIVTNAGICLRMLAGQPAQLEGARETAQRMIRDARRVSEMITRLRGLFARRAATAEAVDLNAAAREVIALASGELRANRVIARVELADDLPAVAGDRIQLQQVIVNLLLNAVEAMRDVRDKPRRMVVETAADSTDRVRLTVRDSGVGFDPGRAETLFEAFHSTKSGGMGIGLSVSRAIIERHGGRLWASRNDGPGAAFSFSIPVRPA